VSAPGESPAGVEFPVTVLVRNLGGETIENLRLANNASSGVERLAASASVGQVDATTGDWVIGRLEPLAAAELTLTVCAEQEGVARLGAEVIPPGARVAVSGQGSHETRVEVTAAPVVEFQDLATYRGDGDNPWQADLSSGLTRRVAVAGGTPPGVGVTAYGFGRVLRFDPDILGALPARVGLVWSGAGAGLAVDVYDSRGRRIARRASARSAADFGGLRFLAVEHDPGIAMLVVQTDGQLEEIQVTTHCGVPVPEGLVFEATGSETGNFAAGRIGAGYDCAQVGEGYLFPNAMTALAGAAAVEFWLRPNADLHGGTSATSLVRMPAGGIDVWYEAGFVRARVPLTAGSPIVVSARADLVADQWRHLAITIGDGKVKILIAGRVTAVEALAGEFAMPATGVVLGAGFNGALDEFAVYARELSDATVAKLARQTRRGKVRPQVRAAYRRDVVELTWPTFFDGYVVQAATRVGANADWSAHDQYKHVHGGAYEVSLPAAAGYRYFRLVRPTNSPTANPSNNPSQ